MTADEQSWPRAGARVDVHLAGSGGELVAVVDDVRPPDQLHLREPVNPDGSPGPCAPVGTPLLLGWATAVGYHRLPAVLTGVPEVRVRLWRLQPAGPVEVLQRREFIRVRDVLPVELHRGEQMWLASVCDLSEGGARCVLSARAPLEKGDHVQVEADIEGVQVRVDAVVIEVERVDESRASARLRFAELHREGDVIRRRVLDVQRRARALGRL